MTSRQAVEEVAEWQWELNGAGDPSRIWIDHRDSGSTKRSEHAVDAGFEQGTWVIRLTLPNDLTEVADEFDPAFVLMGLSDAARRLDEKMVEAVELCRARGCSWEVIGRALGVTRQSAWRKYGVADDT